MKFFMTVPLLQISPQSQETAEHSLTTSNSYIIILTYPMEVVMDKIMSTRMDDAVIRHIGMLAKRLGTSKKAVLENAVRHYAEKIDAEHGIDVFSYTFGSWQRDESAAETVKSVKGTMRQSQERYKR